MYSGEIKSTPLLYKDDSTGNMYSFWASFSEFNEFGLQNYSGNFTQILDFYFEVGYHLDFKKLTSNLHFTRTLQNNPHWTAVDTENTFLLDAFNQTFNGIFPEEIPNPFPFKHTRLRFNDTLIHTPPLMINSISNTLLKYK